MNGNRPSGTGVGVSRTSLSNLGDERLLATFRKVLKATGSPPLENWVELAKADITLRMADTELATLVEGPGLVAAAPVRRANGAPRLAVFNTDQLSVEIKVGRGSRPGSWQVLGRLTPPAAAKVGVRRQQQAEQASVTTDVLGCFVIEGLSQGPMSLVIEVSGRRPVVTEWLVIGSKD
jgi:hypothetical protein